MKAKTANASSSVVPKKKGTDKKQAEPTQKAISAATDDPEVAAVFIPLAEIELYPGNYRKYYDPIALGEFAAGMKAICRVISPITLRKVGTKRYQLVVGERRCRGARIAGFTHIPSVVGEFTDEQMEEIQLQENIQREDPHPMHEAEGVRRLYARKLRTEDIALKLGKSVTWVYNRSKLSGLIPDIQEMFLANIFTVSQAYEIADLAPEAQEAFFTRYCKSWKDKRPIFKNLSHYISCYKCDLTTAPFDVKDARLLPEEGACIACRHNTAFAGLLIPDLDGPATCTRLACFDKKVNLQLTQTVTATLTREEPVALLIDGSMPDNIKAILDAIPGTADIPVYQVENITLIEEPGTPVKEDFVYNEERGWAYEEEGEEEETDDDTDITSGDDNSDDEEDEDTDQEGQTFDKDGFEEAQQEYKELMEEYRSEISNGKSLKGYLIAKQETKIVYYYPVPAGKRLAIAPQGKPAKIKDLIAAKQDTPELLQAEIDRIQTREVRSKVLDVEKVQVQIHKELVGSALAEKTALSRTDQDRLAARWLIFHSLTHYVRSEVETFLDIHVNNKSKPEAIFEAISKMTDSEYTGLIRMALAGLPESKVPDSISGYFLRQVAEGAGVNTEAITKKQSARAQARVDNQEVKIAIYQKRIKRLETNKAA